MRGASARLVLFALAALAAGASACSSRDPDAATTNGGVDGGTASGGAADGSTSGTPGQPALPGIPSTGTPSIPQGENDPPSNGGTITFQNIGSTGWYPSRRDPASKQCDALSTDTCCMAKETVTSDKLTPWDQDLMITLRGPMHVKQLVTYQPDPTNTANWNLVSSWDERTMAAPKGMAFDLNGTDKKGFDGDIGSECLVQVSTDRPFTCGPGSDPYCPPQAAGHKQYVGWAGSKMFVMLATMPHADKFVNPCSKDATGNWYDAPWMGLGLGELARAGAFASCQCFAKDPAKWWLADGCGQINLFEVVNDNNASKNLGVFSTNFIGYGGYVGEGPCGAKCDVTKLGAEVDLIDKSAVKEAAQGALSNPTKGPGAAFRRPDKGYRYFVVLMDVSTRTVQMAVVHPDKVPASMAALLPSIPAVLPRAAVDAVLATRLPR